MDLSLNEEQLFIQDSTERWILNDYNFDVWQKLVVAHPNYSQEHKAAITELSWLFPLLRKIVIWAARMH